MNSAQPRSGYTLPVFATAAAVAAYQYLKGQFPTTVSLNLLEPPITVEIAIEQGAKLKENLALAITRSDPGDNLDLTRHTPVWAMVKTLPAGPEPIVIKGGEGIGKKMGDGSPAIYAYAQNLLKSNLRSYLTPEETIEVTIILPAGRQLAQRTANQAFGIVEGLSLLGTTGISQPLSAPAQLELYLQELTLKAAQFPSLVFCIGENGLDLAAQVGFNSAQLLKTANWLGPMLVSAALADLSSLLLFGYHGKLIKLAGGIFHTHHHLADGRLEILTAHLALLGLPKALIQQVYHSPTCESALALLRKIDQDTDSRWVEQAYGAIATSIEQRCQAYLRKHTEKKLLIGTVLFDGQRQILVKSENALKIFPELS